MSIPVLQSSWWGRESWLLCLICLPGVSWWLSGSSSRCHGVVCSLWLWYFLIILTYYFWNLRSQINAWTCTSLLQSNSSTNWLSRLITNFHRVPTTGLQYTVSLWSAKDIVHILWVKLSRWQPSIFISSNQSTSNTNLLYIKYLTITTGL